MSLDTVLWILAIVCFTVAAFVGDRLPRVGLVPLGLALASLTFVVS